MFARRGKPALTFQYGANVIMLFSRLMVVVVLFLTFTECALSPFLPLSPLLSLSLSIYLSFNLLPLFLFEVSIFPPLSSFRAALVLCPVSRLAKRLFATFEPCNIHRGAIRAHHYYLFRTIYV